MKACGMDLGKRQDQIFFEDRTWTITHDRPGWEQLHEKLPADCVLIIEGRCPLLEASLLKRTIYTINPFKSHQLQQAFGEANDDVRAAQMLARMWETHPDLFAKVEPRTPEEQKLWEHTRMRRNLVQMKTAATQQLEAFRPRPVNQKKSNWLKGFVNTAGQALVETLKTLQTQLEALEKEIKEMVKRLPEYANLCSIKGLGQTLASEILAETRNMQGFESYRQIQCFGGTAPVTLQSGGKKRVAPRRRCNRHLRNALFLFANLSRKWNPWAERYYLKLRAGGRKHTQAVMALANRWVPILFALVKTNTYYDASVLKKECAQAVN